MLCSERYGGSPVRSYEGLPGQRIDSSAVHQGSSRRLPPWADDPKTLPSFCRNAQRPSRWFYAQLSERKAGLPSQHPNRCDDRHSSSPPPRDEDAILYTTIAWPYVTLARTVEGGGACRLRRTMPPFGYVTQLWRVQEQGKGYSKGPGGDRHTTGAHRASLSLNAILV
ncbi:hypothetical protein BD626DRAFT_266455 [Schizophyllum amplum]|uniref:Uncharacterized protein n=1 Tax=Schizophyllum amplum TaxID=97359 RepID=A0A550CHC5_9AGAR|nr:hypothetical protein BD626DRAFT_266455 [Auriculariopsis ampla]